jgi:hypothetical protein
MALLSRTVAALASALLACRVAADAPPPPSLSCGAGLCVASGLGSGMVLQQGPARAALFGSVPAGSPAGAAVTVSLNATDGSYSKTFSTAAMADGTWKVLLDARPGGRRLRRPDLDRSRRHRIMARPGRPRPSDDLQCRRRVLDGRGPGRG